MILVNESRLPVAWMIGKIQPPRWTATLIVKGTFRLPPGKPAVPAAEPRPLTGDVFQDDDPAKPLVYATDFVYRKARTDLLVVGHAHAPGGVPTTAMRASFHVGSLTKACAVIGNRIRSRTMMMPTNTPPEPFRTMELTYAKAFGGPHFKLNPLGTGAEEVLSPEGKRIRRLPNIENVEALMLDSDSRVDPTSFTPMPITWPQRLRKAGTYRDKWRKERWPWFPEDLDWGCFNAAPEDQQLRTPLKGDEPVSFENLHPKHPLLESRLPGIRVRCLYGAGRDRLQDVSMAIDTLWAHPEAETLVLVWRGWVDLPSEKPPQGSYLLVASEPLAQAPNPISHYEQLLSKRIAEAEGKLDLLLAPTTPPPESPIPEVPAIEATPAPPEEVSPAEEEIERLLSGLPHPKPPPPLDASAALALLPELLAAAGVKIPSEESAPAEAEAPPRETPPPAEPEAHPRSWCQARLARGESLAGLDLSGVDLSELDLKAVSFRASVLTGAGFARSRLAGADFTDAVLAGANFDGADLTGATLDNADLSSASLVGSDLTEVSAARAQFPRARLRGAKLERAKAAGALLAKADLGLADLRGATLTGADLAHASLHRADLSEADLTEAVLEGVVGNRATARKANLTRVRAAGSNFGEAKFHEIRAPRSVWCRAQLFRADFSGASLGRAHFGSAYLVQSNFAAADLTRAGMDEAVLRRSILLRTNLLQASFRKADLTGADLRESNLFQAELFEAVTLDASFQGANTKRTLLP